MIVAGDIQFLLSAPMAASGYTMPGVPGNSLGAYVSTTQVITDTQDNLFTDLTGSQNAADQVDYQALFIFNTNTTHTMLSPVAWLPAGLITGTCTLAIAADPTLPSSYTASGAQALAILNPLQAPAGISTWAAPSSGSSGGVELSDIPALSVAAVWIRRTASGSASSVSFTPEVTFSTLP